MEYSVGIPRGVGVPRGMGLPRGISICTAIDEAFPNILGNA